MSILTTILVVVSFKYSTLCRIKRRSFLKVVSPLEYVCSKLCILSNRVQINNSCTLNVSNTSVNNFNTSNTTSILTVSVNSCSSNRTKTITLNSDLRSSSISRTCRNDRNRNNTTIVYNRLCNSTRSRTQDNIRIRGIRSTTVGDVNTLDRTTNRCYTSCTSSTTTNNSNRRLRGVSCSAAID